METIELGIERELTFETAEGISKATLQISRIQKSDQGSWKCTFYLPVIIDKEFEARGVDALEALTNALHLITKLVNDSTEDKWVRIWWLKPGDDGGF